MIIEVILKEDTHFYKLTIFQLYVIRGFCNEKYFIKSGRFLNLKNEKNLSKIDLTLILTFSLLLISSKQHNIKFSGNAVLVCDNKPPTVW